MGIPRRQKDIAGTQAYVDGIRYVMPIDSWDASAMIAAFPCNYEAAASMLPPGYVHPFRYFGKALLVITVIDYRKTDIGSYIEYSVAIACTKGRSPAPPLLPAVFLQSFGTGQFVIDLPVSSEVSVKGGKGIWGMPKHKANLDYKEGKAWVSAQYDLDGQMVSRFDVRVPKSYPIPLNMGAVNYCQFRGMIYRSFIYFKGRAGVHLMQPSSARFILGDHPRADWVRTLEHRPSPLFAAYIPKVQGALDDYFDCWFVTPKDRPDAPIGEGLETTYPLGFSEGWLASPTRDPNFDLDRE